MSAKKYNSDRKRSRPVTKRRKTDVFKKNRLVTAFVLIIIVVVVIAGVYVVYTRYIENDNNGSGDQNNGSNGQGTNESNPIAVIDTSMGTIRVELYDNKVPVTAVNFIDLANDGFYDGTKIHRISPNFMIQGGCPNSKDNDPSDDGYGGPGYTIQDEFDDDLHNDRGMISMANSGPNTGGSQFFILVRDSRSLDNHHAVFGKVIEGMDVVDDISDMNHDGRYEPNPGGGRPLTDVVINSITIGND